MRILHVGRDFVALRRCGLTLYSDALMRGQAAAGHEVGYFFAGRHYPGIRRPRLRRWKAGRVTMLELIASPITSHWTLGTRVPLHDLEEPAVEAMFAATLRERRPEIVHIHELTGLPSSLIPRAKEAGARVVMTLHDYTSVCATTRLLDSNGERCLRRDIGEDCARNCSGAPAGDSHLVEATLQYEMDRALGTLPLPGRVRVPLLQAGQSVARRALARRNGTRPASTEARPEHYQRRRDVNIARLEECDRLVAPSQRVAEIFAALGVSRERLELQRLTLPHLVDLTPGRSVDVSKPVVFVTLGGCTTPSKGAFVIADALRLLHEANGTPEFRLIVLGQVSPDVAPALESNPSVDLRGPYLPEHVSSHLDEADIGLMPSVWEEVHGFVGIEMLAKGLPIIGTDVGGIPEYVHDGETGWLNHAGTARELADLMLRAIESPAAVRDLRRSVRARRATLVRPMADHLAEVGRMYASILPAGT